MTKKKKWKKRKGLRINRPGDGQGRVETREIEREGERRRGIRRERDGE